MNKNSKKWGVGGGVEIQLGGGYQLINKFLEQTIKMCYYIWQVLILPVAQLDNILLLKGHLG